MKLQIDIVPDTYFRNETQIDTWCISEVANNADLFINTITVFLRETI